MGQQRGRGERPPPHTLLGRPPRRARLQARLGDRHGLAQRRGPAARQKARGARRGRAGADAAPGLRGVVAARVRGRHRARRGQAQHALHLHEPLEGAPGAGVREPPRHRHQATGRAGVAARHDVQQRQAVHPPALAGAGRVRALRGAGGKRGRRQVPHAQGLGQAARRRPHDGRARPRARGAARHGGLPAGRACRGRLLPRGRVTGRERRHGRRGAPWRATE